MTHILLAEDEDHIAKLIEFKLAKEGFEITVARDGREAISLLTEKPWSLLILDVLLPVCDGWQVLQAVRALPELISLPVLIMSARNYPNMEVAGKGEMGAQQYLKKPFDPNDLVQVVKRMVKYDR